MRILFFLVFSFSTLVGIAQNATLTKGETVEYLNRKFKEMEGLHMNNFQYYRNPKVSIAGNILTVEYELVRTSNQSHYELNVKSFNPIYITSIIKAEGNDALYMKLSIPALLHKKRDIFGTHSSGTHESTHILYPKGNSDLADKITKALFHLRDLIKAEDNQF